MPGGAKDRSAGRAIRLLGDAKGFFGGIDANDFIRSGKRKQQGHRRAAAAAKMQNLSRLMLQGVQEAAQVFDAAVSEVILGFTRGAEALLKCLIVTGGELIKSGVGAACVVMAA